MRLGKPKTDGERLAEAIKKLERIRLSYSHDAWSFIGAVLTEYHALFKAATLSGEIDDLRTFEASVLSMTTFTPTVPTSGASTPMRQEPYR